MPSFSHEDFESSRETFKRSELYKTIEGYCHLEAIVGATKLECWNHPRYGSIIVQLFPNDNGFAWFVNSSYLDQNDDDKF